MGQILLRSPHSTIKNELSRGLQLTIYFPDGKSERTDRPDKITHIEPNSVGDSILTKLLEITRLK